MVANRFGLLVLCFSDWFFFPSEELTKDLWSTFYVEEAMEKRSEWSFLTFVSRPVPFKYIPPTGNECGRKPIAMYVISRQSWRLLMMMHGHYTKAEKQAQLDCFSKDFHQGYPTKDRAWARLCSVVWRTGQLGRLQSCRTPIAEDTKSIFRPWRRAFLNITPWHYFSRWNIKSGAAVLVFSCACSYVRIKSI